MDLRQPSFTIINQYLTIINHHFRINHTLNHRLAINKSSLQHHLIILKSIIKHRLTTSSTTWHAQIARHFVLALGLDGTEELWSRSRGQRGLGALHCSDRRRVTPAKPVQLWLGYGSRWMVSLRFWLPWSDIVGFWCWSWVSGWWAGFTGLILWDLYTKRFEGSAHRPMVMRVSASITLILVGFWSAIFTSLGYHFVI